MIDVDKDIKPAAKEAKATKKKGTKLGGAKTPPPPAGENSWDQGLTDEMKTLNRNKAERIAVQKLHEERKKLEAENERERLKQQKEQQQALLEQSKEQQKAILEQNKEQQQFLLQQQQLLFQFVPKPSSESDSSERLPPRDQNKENT